MESEGLVPLLSSFQRRPQGQEDPGLSLGSCSVSENQRRLQTELPDHWLSCHSGTGSRALRMLSSLHSLNLGEPGFLTWGKDGPHCFFAEMSSNVLEFRVWLIVETT